MAADIPEAERRTATIEAVLLMFKPGAPPTLMMMALRLTAYLPVELLEAAAERILLKSKDGIFNPIAALQEAAEAIMNEIRSEAVGRSKQAYEDQLRCEAEGTRELVDSDELWETSKRAKDDYLASYDHVSPALPSPWYRARTASPAARCHCGTGGRCRFAPAPRRCAHAPRAGRLACSLGRRDQRSSPENVLLVPGEFPRRTASGPPYSFR